MALQRIIEILFMILIYIGCPILLIMWLKRRKAKPKAPRNYKIINVPLLILNALPTIFGVLIQEEFLQWDSEFWEAAVVISMLVTIIVTIIQTKLTGLWLGPLRCLIGGLLGASIAASVILFLGLCLVIGFAISSSGKRYSIYRNGKWIYLDSSNGTDFYDEDGNCYTMNENGKVSDAYGLQYVIK